LELIGGYNHNHEIIEIFHFKNNKIKNKVLYNSKETKTYLKNNNLLKRNNEINFVFDLHNVLDLLSDNFKINRKPNYNIICCSYVGRNSSLRQKATEEIINRMKSKQINWGVLVFNRGKRRNGDERFNYHLPGSKAMFCDMVQADYFYDDSMDHIMSVKSLFNKNKLKIQSIHIDGKDKLMNIINEIKNY
jgi:hypothetical protein